MDGVQAGSLFIPEDELVERFSRSSGPGGQSVNTSDTRAELRWNIATSAVLTEVRRERLLGRLRLVDGVLIVVAAEHRSQWRNRQTARARLAAMVAEGLRPPPPVRRATRPGRSAREARIAAKKRRSQTKQRRGRVDPGSA
ncbi:MAG TPA: alternative ribosome rescue aminoacyl-tRNA hydrolase ArfB [Mycobacteriales bacterium]|nr:alternative ribosome rescue aminoacyl-tRNA hydrolase ArfB [Mycobacteriales bacterium]